MKKTSVLFSLLLLLVAPVCADEALGVRRAVETKIAFIDLDAVFTVESPYASEEYKQRLEDLGEEVQEMAKEARQDEERARQLQTELSSKDKTKWSSDDVRERKVEELERLVQKLEGSKRQVQTKIERRSMAIQSEVYGKLEKAAEKVKKQQGWDVVWPVTKQIPVGPMGGLSNRIDVTKDVVSVVNSEYNKQRSAAKPAVKSEAPKKN